VTDRWHTQTLVGGGHVAPEERGDCVRACVTSILGLPIDSIANVVAFEDWWGLLRLEVNRFGFEVAYVDVAFEPPMGYWIATVPSLNLPPEPDGERAMHCVVARGYELIHDPACGKRYDAESWVAAWNAGEVVAGKVLYPIDPAMFFRQRYVIGFDAERLSA
jgi:hypothetical protein